MSNKADQRALELETRPVGVLSPAFPRQGFLILKFLTAVPCAGDWSIQISTDRHVAHDILRLSSIDCCGNQSAFTEVKVGDSAGLYGNLGWEGYRLFSQWMASQKEIMEKTGCQTIKIRLERKASHFEIIQ